MARSVRFAAAAAAAALSIGLVAGCGGSSSGSSSEAASSTSADVAMTKDDFVAQANAICAQSFKDLQDLGDLQNFSSATDLATRGGATVDIAKKQYAAIAALPAPADIAASVNTYIENGRKSTAILQELLTRVAGGEDFAAAQKETVDSEAQTVAAATRVGAAFEAGIQKCAT